MKRLEIISKIAILFMLGGFPFGCGTEVGNGNKEVTADETDKDKTSKSDAPQHDTVFGDDVAGATESKVELGKTSVAAPHLGLILTKCAGVFDEVDLPLGLVGIFDTGEKTDFTIQVSKEDVFKISSAGNIFTATTSDEMVSVENSEIDTMEYVNNCSSDLVELDIKDFDFKADEGFTIILNSEDDETPLTLNWFYRTENDKKLLVGLELLINEELALTLDEPE
jgi:hypothetical protein